jgi:hypothetical protein
LEKIKKGIGYTKSADSYIFKKRVWKLLYWKLLVRYSKRSHN